MHDQIEIAFGPVPSRRLGSSLGVNNIPLKHCSYNCVYCQIGKGLSVETVRRAFYDPKVVFESVRKRLEVIESKGERVDFITFVPDGEPTLDINLGKEIELVKTLGIKVAVITNSSLLWDKEVRDALSIADFVSFKVDAVSEKIWRIINRPSNKLSLERILEGIITFSELFRGTLVSETMLVAKINYGDEAGKIASFLSNVNGLKKAYVAVPTRPPAEEWAGPPERGTVLYFLARFNEILGSKVFPLDFPEKGEFGYTGNAEKDILSAALVHPLSKEAVQQILEKDNASWETIEKLIESKQLLEVKFGDKLYYRAAKPENPF
ncbi:MAG: radical SAM protein [Nitrososphaeria archaeon]